MSGWVALMESNTTGTGRILARRVRARGLRPLLVTANPERYDYPQQDELDVAVVDTTSCEAVVAAIRSRTGDACRGVTTSSERAVAVTARVAAALGLPGEDPDAVERCRDKACQRRTMAAAGLPVPAYRVCATPEEAGEAASFIGPPVVVKPTHGTGSSGVRSCTEPGEARTWAGRLLDAAAGEAVLVERKLTGPEYSVELVGGRVLGVTATRLGAEPYFVETGHDFPADLSTSTAALLAAQARAAVHALGVGTVAAHVELRLEPGGPVVVEVNPRLAGGMIPRLIQLAVGLDPIAALLDVVTGREWRQEPSRQGHAAIRFVVPGNSGTIRAISGVSEARRSPGVVEVTVASKVGTEFAHRQDFQDRIGHVISVGPGARITGERADRALRLIHVAVDSGAGKGAGAQERTKMPEAEEVS